MLDLTTFNSFYELKWFDGTLLHIRKPSEELLREITKLEGMEPEDQFNKMKDITIKILSDNEEGKKFTAQEKKKLDFVACGMIIKDYMETLQKRLGE